MVSALLDDHITSFDQIFVFIHHHVNFAGQNHRIIQTVSAVHKRMARAFNNIRTSAHFRKCRFAIKLGQLVGIFRIKLDNAKNRTIFRWMQNQRAGHRIIMPFHCRWGFGVLP